MNFFHVLNFAIPIVSMIALGYVVDRMCKPVPIQQEKNNK
ncbi:hypothetical protein J2S07_001862 [Robertmurraya andreesenii]|uniref:Uncharacterized protein n=1 Tax=Anoxybacillus andreesenii TaxID=1325932 RepID=A0ABT9V3M8_9BACL|nr:hypothetical protein [Robertmurraya andreesenii]